MRIPALIVAILGFLMAGTIVYAAGMPNRLSADDVVYAIREQVELLKWAGGAMVTGLAAAVVLLWQSLQTAHKEQKEICQTSAQADEKLADAVNALHNELTRRPCLKDTDHGT